MRGNRNCSTFHVQRSRLRLADEENYLYFFGRPHHVPHHSPYWGIHKHSKQHVYRAAAKNCSVCPVKLNCTKDRARSVSYHIYEDALRAARELSTTKGYYLSQRMRKKIEELFGEAKELMGFRRAKFRGRKWIKEQVLMTATAQNIKRMVIWRLQECIVK